MAFGGDLEHRNGGRYETHTTKRKRLFSKVAIAISQTKVKIFIGKVYFNKQKEWAIQLLSQLLQQRRCYKEPQTE